MADQENFNFPFDWSNFEKYLNEQMSVLSKGPSGHISKNPRWMEMVKDQSWMQSFMQDVFKKAAPPQVLSSSTGANSDVFETHDNVFARVKLPENANPRAMQVLIGANNIKLEGLPEGRTQFIRLPEPVLPKSAKATYKNGVLQVQMRKSGDKEKFIETFVRFL